LIYAVVIPAAIVAVLALLVTLFVQRGREGLDLSPRTLVRLYLYLASLAGVILLVFGLSALGNAGLAAVAGNDVVYGGPAGWTTFPEPMPACPPGVDAKECPQPPSAEEQQRQQRQHREQQERRRAEDLIRGLTFTAFGALFWGTHWAARRGVIGPDERGSALRRAYLMSGTGIFGLATIVLLPSGVYQLLSNALLPSGEDRYVQGVADSLMGGVAAAPVWLLFLWLVVRDLRPAADR
jgi:hypothetical protein